MDLFRFFLGLALLVLAMLLFEFTNDPLAEVNAYTKIGGAFGGVMGSLFWGLIIWAPIRFIRGADKAPDVRRFSIYTAAIFVALFIIFRSLVGEPLSSKPERLAFLSGMDETCFSTQRNLEVNVALTDAQLQEYCSCHSSSLNAAITEEEIKYMVDNEVSPASLKEKSQKVAKRCSQKLLQQWNAGNDN